MTKKELEKKVLDLEQMVRNLQTQIDSLVMTQRPIPRPAPRIPDYEPYRPWYTPIDGDDYPRPRPFWYGDVPMCELPQPTNLPKSGTRIRCP